MRRLILGLVDDPDSLEISRYRGDVAIEGERIQTFDDAALVEGQAVGSVRREPEVPVVGDEYITTETEPQIEEVYTEFLADESAGYVAVDRGDGTVLWDALEALYGIRIERAHLDLDAIARDLETVDRDERYIWQVGYDREDGDAVGIQYHQDAALEDALQGGGVSQLGFHAQWHGERLRGTVASSGYVALFTDATAEVVGQWLRDAILPHAYVSEDDQATLDERADEREVVGDD